MNSPNMSIEQAATIRRLESELDKFRKAERELSEAYVRLRFLIPGALDTHTAPTPQQIWDITEAALKRLLDDLLQAENKLKEISRVANN